jgi:hypothetical protein
MSEKYTNKRPTIPAFIKRTIAVESGHACAVRNCNEHTYNEYHHIDGNRENNDPLNLIFLCDKHHKMAHSGKIDRKALRAYKKLNDPSIVNPVNSFPQTTGKDEKRKRDIENILWIIGTIHFPTLDDHIDNLPRRIRDQAFHFWESYKGVINSSLFYLYDEELKNILIGLYHAWDTSLSFGERYQATSSGINNTYIFSNPMDAPLDESQEKDWNIIEQAAKNIYAQKNKLLSHLRDNYIEVDINDCNQCAWNDYLSFQREL